MAECCTKERMTIALAMAALFGFFCAYGTSTIEIPGFTMTMEYMLTIFYSRLMIGLLVGFAGCLVILKKPMANAALRGAMLGGIMSIGISFYGGAEIFIMAGIIYGMITDVVATRFG
jgi:ABC-type Mn2+/Zn2+ transport system permease subunit